MNKVFLLVFSLASFSCHAMEIQDSKWDAELYDANSKQQYEASLENLSKFELSSAQFETIVELGSNTANVSAHLAETYPQKTIVAIDPESAAIELARTKHENAKNLKCICDTAQKFSLKEHSISPANFVGCYHVLHWIPRDELQQVFNNTAANMAENGILDVSMSAKQRDTSLTKAVLKTFLNFKYWGLGLTHCVPYLFKEKISGQHIVTRLNSEEIHQMATNAGLKVDRCEETDEVMSFDSPEEFCPWLTTILKPYGIETVPKEQREAFVKDAVGLYCEQYNPGKNGKVEYRLKGLHLTAHKSSIGEH